MMRLTIGKKLAFGFGVVISLTVAIATIAYVKVAEMHRDIAEVTDEAFPTIGACDRLMSGLNQTAAALRGYIILSDDPQLAEELKASRAEGWRTIDQELQNVIRLARNRDREADNAEITNLVAVVDEIRAAQQSVEDIAHPERNISARQDLESQVDPLAEQRQANHLFATETMPRMVTIRATLERLTDAAMHRKEARVAALFASSRELTFTLVLATLLAVGIGTLVAVLLSRQIIGTARKLAERAQQIASGDLTGAALVSKSADELGQLANGFDGMLLGLRDLTGQILSVTENVNSAATQISSSATQQAVSTKEQAATVQEITSTMQEISQSGMQIVEKARAVASTAEATATASKSGIQAVQTTNSSMRAIREQVEEVAENIVALSEKTQAVGDIIATVTDVAEQSNLLALNATIEAAEAGAEGNRFSVVASEMKNLADQAKGCTVQVRTILSEIQKGINSAVMLTEEAVKRVELGKQQAELSEASIRQMSETTHQSVHAFQQIIAATNQQQVGFDQVTQGMRDIDQATQQTATGTSQLEQAVLSLSSLSQQLKTAVATYRV